MAGLENLFATEPSLPNVQKIKLPESPEKWGEVMTTLMREQFADISKLPMTIEFKKKDDQTGCAIGAIHVVSPEANKALFVPFVIEKFHLHPLDVWMEKDTQAVHPLTKDTFKEMFFVQSFAEGLDGRPEDGAGTNFNSMSMWNQNMPPASGRYAYASAGYSMLDQIADTLTEEDIEGFKDALRAEPMLLARFERNGHKELIQKLAAKKSTASKPDFKAQAEKLIPAALIDVRKEGTDNYSLLMSGQGVFDLSVGVQSMDRQACEQFLSRVVGKPQDFLNEVDRCGEKVLRVPEAASGVYLYDKKDNTAVDATEFQCYIMKNKNGLQLDAIVIPDVVDYSGKRVSGRVVLSKTHSCFQAKVAGTPNPGSHCKDSVLKPQTPRVGQMGTFVYVGDNGKAIATVPVTLVGIESYDLMSVQDVHGKKFKIRQGWGDSFGTSAQDPQPTAYGDKPGKSLESLGFVELSKDYKIIPSKMMWITMEPMTDLCATPDEVMEKTAAEKMDIDPVKVRFTGVVYEFEGNGLPKLAMPERDARALLVSLGADLEKAAKVMDKARRVGQAKAHGCHKLASKNVAIQAEKTAHEALVKQCAELRRTFVKEAAEIDNAATVDTMLALGFLNSNNLAKFVSYVPVIEKCADFLAEIVLASRLGLKQVETSAAVSAMSKLLEVLEGLKKIEGSMKKPATKLA